MYAWLAGGVVAGAAMVAAGFALGRGRGSVLRRLLGAIAAGLVFDLVWTLRSGALPSYLAVFTLSAMCVLVASALYTTKLPAEGP